MISNFPGCWKTPFSNWEKQLLNSVCLVVTTVGRVLWSMQFFRMSMYNYKSIKRGRGRVSNCAYTIYNNCSYSSWPLKWCSCIVVVLLHRQYMNNKGDHHTWISFQRSWTVQTAVTPSIYVVRYSPSPLYIVLIISMSILHNLRLSTIHLCMCKWFFLSKRVLELIFLTYVHSYLR